jgi:prepilin-type N-terminal cleavage/methylation domain-containing protein
LQLTLKRNEGNFMKMLKLNSSQKGFTLIELMIVVGIIGILVAIAAPNFARYQSKARQSEAKIALAAVYGAEKSFYSEYAAYAGSMDAIGYSPEGSKRFYGVGYAGAHSSTISGYSGVLTSGSWTAVNNSFTSCGTAPALGTTLTGDAQTFIAAATGCIRQGSGAFDTWNITDMKVISNNVISL